MRRLPFFLLLALTASASDYRYALSDGGISIHNGPAYFNRPLFGTHEPTMLMSGDRPAFAYFSPDDLGKVGTLYVGIVTPAGGKWLHQFADIRSTYQPGLTRHVVEDPLLGGGSLELTAVPLSMAEGFLIRLQWRKPPTTAVRLVWSFGGASGYRTNYSARVDKLHLSPADAEGNQVRIEGTHFSLEAPTMKGRQLLGTCDLPGRLALADPQRVLEGPAEASPSKAPVAQFGGDWTGTTPVHLLFALSDATAFERLAAQPAQVFEESVRFYRTLARRVEVKTSDPYFDLAVESMVIANDGLWQPPAFLHGAVSWMHPYLGWRGWYGTETMGFHDRVRSAIQAFAARQLKSGYDRGAIPHTLTAKGVFYNMNEVFLDQVYYHYLWTGDRSFLASLLPVIDGILTWSKRRLDPDDNALYESCLNTWISDSHWYSGGDTTQSSAYLFRAYQLAAAAAEAAGKDPAPYRREMERIRTAMNRSLWLAPRGHFAEFIDRIGLRRLHPEPELPTLYTPIDVGVTDDFQAYQMLRFTETRLQNETAIPRGGRLAWSSNWAPNFNRQFTHSTRDLVYAEQLHLALAYYRTGQAQKAYELVKGTYAGLYQGGIPGGLACHTFENGQQRANEEFADSISMFLRLAVEGVFGIRPEKQNGLIHLMPGLPAEWPSASITTPDFSYRLRKSATEIVVETTAPAPVRVHFQIPIAQARLLGATLDGQTTAARIRPGIGGAFVELTTAPAMRSELHLRLEPRAVTVDYPRVIAQQERLSLAVAKTEDPQHVLTAGPGPHTLFARVADWWQPIDVEVRPRFEITATEPGANCRFRLRNNTAEPVHAPATITWAGRTSSVQLSVPAHEERPFEVQGNPSEFLLGANRLEVAVGGKPIATTSVLNWTRADAARYQPVAIESLFNDSFATILAHRFWTSDYPYAVCCDYMFDHLAGSRSWVPDDRRLRAAVDAQGLFHTRYGIPFAQRAEGKNLVAVGRWNHLPASIDVPLEGKARRIYLLYSAFTFAMQSHIANARVTLEYADGGTTLLDLVNPENLDNGWGKPGGTYHYAAAGSEVIGEPLPPPAELHPVARRDVILRQHPAPSAFVQPEWEQAPLPPHADILDVPCDRTRPLRRLKLEALSNEVIVALLGVTALR